MAATPKLIGWVGEIPPWTKPWWRRPKTIAAFKIVGWACMSAGVMLAGALWIVLT